FANIIYQSYRLLSDHFVVAQSIAARYASFLMDEFQDTTELQIEILKIIHAQGRSQFFVVGDPAQSIFGFTGARPELLTPFAEYVGARTDLSLSGNFRSNPQIIDHAELLFPRSPPMASLGPNRSSTETPTLVQPTTTFQAITEQFLPTLAELD